MATPIIPDLAEAQAEALSGTVDVDTGVKHQVLAADDNSVPSAFAQLMNLERKLMLLLAGSNRGQVIWSGSGLTVGADPLEYELAGAAYSFAGDETFSLSLPVNDTSYVYLDTAATLKSQVSSWPVGDIFKLAKVTTNATQVTAITDMRAANFQVGIVNAWWTVPPTALVSLNNQDLDKIKTLGFEDPTTVALDVDGKLSLAGQPTFLFADTYLSAALDDLESFGIFDTTDKGNIFILRAADAARTVTVKAAAMLTAYGDFVMDDLSKFICLISRGSGVTELFRSHITIPTLGVDLDAAGFDITDVGIASAKQSSLTIAAGAITVTGGYHSVDTEAAAAEDDLDTINGGAFDGQILILRVENAGHAVNVRASVGNVVLWNSLHHKMQFTSQRLILLFDGTNWIETGRSHQSIADLVATGNAIPYAIDVRVSGVLSTGVVAYKRHCPQAFTIKDVFAHVGTAPTGGPCIVDVLVSGVSMFSDQSEMVNIADGATFDQSAVKNKAVTAGQTIEIEIEAANTAADLAVVINGFIAPKTPPV